MWKPWEWGTRSNARAVHNARLATTMCSRRWLERAEVELYLAHRYDEPQATRRQARTETGS